MFLFGTTAVALVTTRWFRIEAWIKVRGALLLEMTCESNRLVREKVNQL